MGFLDEAKKTLGDAVTKHGDTITDSLDRAGRTIDVKTGGKYGDKISLGVSKAKGAVQDYRRATAPSAGTPEVPVDPDVPNDDPEPPPGPSGPADPAQPTDPEEPAAPAGPTSSADNGGGDPDPVPTDPSPVPPEPGADPNEEIATGGRPVPAGAAAR